MYELQASSSDEDQRSRYSCLVFCQESAVNFQLSEHRVSRWDFANQLLVSLKSSIENARIRDLNVHPIKVLILSKNFKEKLQ